MKFLFLLFFSSLVLFSSCRQLVDDEIADFEMKPTINSIFVTDSLLKVHISLARKIDTTQIQLVDNAQVLLFENGIYKQTLKSLSQGVYISDSTLKAMANYSCKIKVANYDTLYCTDYAPHKPEILKIAHIKNAGIDEEGLAYPAVDITFANNPKMVQYYEIALKLIMYGTESNAELIQITDPIILNEGLPIAIFSNQTINANSYTMRLNYTTGSSGSFGNGLYTMTLFPLKVELRSVSESYYKFMKQLHLYKIGRYPDGFSGRTLAFPLYSNIENGYGIFAGYSVSVSNIINPPNN